MNDLIMTVMRRQQGVPLRQAIAIIDEQQQPLILFAANDPPACLQHFAHTGADISIGESHLHRIIKIFFQQFLPFTYLWKSDPDDDTADQRIAL